MLEEIVDLLDTEGTGLVSKPAKSILLRLVLDILQHTSPLVTIPVRLDVVGSVGGEHSVELTDHGGHGGGVEPLGMSSLENDNFNVTRFERLKTSPLSPL